MKVIAMGLTMVDTKSTDTYRNSTARAALASARKRALASNEDVRSGSVQLVPLTQQTRKSSRPETRRQVETWDRNKRHYVQLGLCSRCAAQAAWGHQLGFTEVHAPCGGCLHVVIGFPVNEPGEWRSDSPRRKAPVSERLASGRPSLPIL
jgi:hypothetical protein